MQRILRSSVVALCASLALAGCARRAAPSAPVPAPPNEIVTTPPPAPPPVQDAPTAVGAEPAALTEDEIFARKTLEELNAETPLTDVFFDLDEVTLREDARHTLADHAKWLSRWPSTRVTIEGHADSRGTNQYNLALGDRRGHGVHAYLESLGIAGARLTVVSRGEESPACTDETEPCWQRNRRAGFIITAK
jgi:peptidoglycan-associated lipoprotein